MRNDLILAVVVITALAFDFTNGFHDTGNAMATSIATHALGPRTAVALSGVLNLVGAFLSLSVAATIASGLVDTHLVTLTVIFAGLTGGILWNLLTWLLSIPSSSSHALIGGVIGATLAAAGGSAVKWHSLIAKVILPAVFSPVIAALVAAAGTWLVYRISQDSVAGARGQGFRFAQIGSASMVSLAHGTNDAQKTMGIITMALIVNGSLPGDARAPFWVIGCAGLAISSGTYIGGWRIIRTLGKGLVEIEAPQGMAAESSSAAVILLSSHFGYPLSTTQVASGSIIGCGLARNPGRVRWRIAGRMAVAWLITLPAAAIVAGGAYGLAALVGGTAGVMVDLALLMAGATVIYLHSRGTKVNHENVNSDWAGQIQPAGPTTRRCPDLRGHREMSSWINFSALGQIVLFGLLAGAGLPALAAVGVRSLYPRRITAGEADAMTDAPGRIVLAVACFAVVLAAIGYAIYLIVAGSH
jgi:inorganic phosphate transporter, PiT family